MPRLIGKGISMEKEMRSSLVDVPVRVNIWIRPECQRAQFEVLRQARPSILFLQSDGGRNPAEWEAIRRNREVFDKEIDWDCTVYRFYEEQNLGLYSMNAKVRKFIWETVDRCVFLEDDYVPAVSFFRYCAELLERYRDDERIECICGMNHLGKCEEVTADYFFSRQGSIWGVATWKSRDLSRDREFTYGSDPYVMKLLRQRTRHNPTFWKRLEAYPKQTHYEGHVAGNEFYYEFAMYGQNRLQIIPKTNQIKNMGCTANAAHVDSLELMPKGLRRAFNIETYEMEFPMKHPQFVIPDVEYEKKRNRIMGYNCPWVLLYRKFERCIRIIFAGKFLNYMKKKIKNKKKIET